MHWEKKVIMALVAAFACSGRFASVRFLFFFGCRENNLPERNDNDSFIPANLFPHSSSSSSKGFCSTTTIQRFADRFVQLVGQKVSNWCGTATTAAQDEFGVPLSSRRSYAKGRRKAARYSTWCLAATHGGHHGSGKYHC